MKEQNIAKSSRHSAIHKRPQSRSNHKHLINVNHGSETVKHSMHNRDDVKHVKADMRESEPILKAISMKQSKKSKQSLKTSPYMQRTVPLHDVKHVKADMRESEPIFKATSMKQSKKSKQSLKTSPYMQHTVPLQHVKSVKANMRELEPNFKTTSIKQSKKYPTSKQSLKTSPPKQDVKTKQEETKSPSKQTVKLSSSKQSIQSKSNASTLKSPITIQSSASQESRITKDSSMSKIRRPSLTILEKVAKCMLIGFNFMFLVTGAAMLGLGVWLLLNPEMKQFMDALFLGTPNEKHLGVAMYTLIGSSCFIILVAFSGCYGAYLENNLLLSLYIFLLLLTFSGEISLVVLAVFYGDKILNILKSNIVGVFSSGKYQPNNIVAKLWDIVQLDLGCCGVYNYTDYRHVKQWQYNERRNVPPSCCVSVHREPNYTDLCQMEALQGISVPNVTVSVMQANSTESYVYLKNVGCFDTIVSFILRQFTIIAGVVSGVTFIELMGILMALILCCNKRKPQCCS